MKKSSTASTRSIGGPDNDPTWRYKRPELKTKIEGRGGSIRTVIMNMRQVCKYLKIDPEYPTKFFSFEFGAKTKWNDESGGSTINGVHDKELLERTLDQFVALFILCPTCDLPEMTISVATKNAVQKIVFDCDACGAVGPLSVKHKLKTFIMKHPPALKKTKKHLQKATPEQNFTPEITVDDEEVVWFTDTSKEAQEARRRAEKGNRLLHSIENEEENKNLAIETVVNLKRVHGENELAKEDLVVNDPEAVEVIAQMPEAYAVDLRQALPT